MDILTISRKFLARKIAGESDSVQEKETGEAKSGIELGSWQTLQGVDDDLVTCSTCTGVKALTSFTGHL